MNAMNSTIKSPKSLHSRLLWIRVVQFATAFLFPFFDVGCAIEKRGTHQSGTDLEAIVEQTQNALVQGDRHALEGLCTKDGWDQIHRCYDFHLGALRFKGTFTDFLQDCGDVMNESNPIDVERDDLNFDRAVLFFDRTNPEGVTIAYQRERGSWRIAYLSPGEIDPKSIFRKRPSNSE